MKEKILSLDKATVFTSGMFGVTAREVLELVIEKGPYAQYPVAYHVSWRMPRKRKREGAVVYSEGSILVVIDNWGWSNIVPDPLRRESDGSRSSRYASFDPRYDAEFRESLQKHTTGCPERVVFDKHVFESK